MNHQPNKDADCAENSEDNYGIELGDSALKSTVSCSEPPTDHMVIMVMATTILHIKHHLVFMTLKIDLLIFY